MCAVCTMARTPNMRRSIISGVFISTKGESIISFVDNRILDFRGFLYALVQNMVSGLLL